MELSSPPGWTRDELFELLTSVSIEGSPPGELAAYVTEDFERFVITWQLVSGRGGPALEIGANPYFTTVLLREFTELDLTLTNSFGEHSADVGTQVVSYRQAAHRVDVTEHFTFAHLNVECDPFPFEDGSFDTVVFCEVVEHLLSDPIRALCEINRVLAAGGALVISTPNVARLENVARLVAGANIYDPYSGYGPYGRHNREFTRHELVRLLEFCGFDVEHHFTADVHPHHAHAYADVERLAPLLGGRLQDLGQYLFCRATKAAAPRCGRPVELFRSWSQDPLVSWSVPATDDEPR